MAIENGSIVDADELLNVMASIWNDAAQNLFNAAYLGFDSRLNGAASPNLDNVWYSIFTSDNAISYEGITYDSTNDKYVKLNLGDLGPFVIIEADDATVNWSSNNCSLLKFGTGKWVLYSTTGTDEVKRAQIHQSLWYGTTGANQLILNFSNITSMQTNIARDVGKRGFYASHTISGDPNQSGYYTGTFSDTTNNLNCSSWALVEVSGSVNKGGWYIPSATERIYQNGDGTINELGTDKTADEVNNPANCGLYVYDYISGSVNTKAIILATGSITWIKDAGVSVGTNIDFYTTHSVPEFEDYVEPASIEILFGLNSDVGVDIDQIIPVINYDTDGTATMTISNDGTNYEAAENIEIFRPSTTGQKALIKLSFTGATEINVYEAALKYNLY